MATFSPAQYQAVIDQITSGLTSFEGNLAKIPPAAQAATSHWWIDPVARETLTWIAEKTVETGTAILNWIKDLLKGAVAPIYLFMDGLDWLDVKGGTAGVATDIGAQKIVIGAGGWSGDAYIAAAGRQADAANRLASIASTTSTTTLSVAGAGLLFYLALAAVLAKLIAASATAIAAFGSAVFSWVGAGIVLEEAGVDSTAV